MASQRPRKGFTLIELLVVIAIITVLLGLLLPAVQKVREAANRIKCENNLKQLGLALHNFYDSHRYFPTTVRPPADNGPSLPRQGWLLFVLPHIEQGPLYNLYDFKYSWFAAANRQVSATPIPILLCPSTPNPNRVDGIPESNPWDSFAAVTDYAAVNSVDPRLQSAGLVDVAGPGLLPKDSQPRIEDVLDGTSNTIALAESAGRPQLYRLGQPVGQPPSPRVNGGGWARAASDITLNGLTADGVSSPGPYAINRANGEDGSVYPSPIYGVQGMGSIYAFHPTGANFAFADGSVHLLSKNVDIRVVARLVTRAGQEVISDGDY
jgi:prepilin-type N-terminal cleavage/methylation domain-containing protein/prepilin-type processing-associated H-X9-DG protein